MNKTAEKQELLDKIVEAIQDVKGEDIMIFDLSKIENSVAETFVICSGNSNTQVNALAGSVEKKSEKRIKRKTLARRRYRKRNVGFGRLRFGGGAYFPETDS